MKYFIYCRKSSEEETKQVQSLETQETMLLDYAKKHDLYIIDVIKESKSAKTDGNRPLFSKMVAEIEQGIADGILVLHIDRLSRNGIEAGKLIKLFETSSLKEIRTPNRIYNSVTDILYMDFDFVFASHYSRNLSIRVKEGNATKRSKGEYIGSVPLGYIYEKGKLVPDPLRAKHVTSAFSLYSSGLYTLSQIVALLYKNGLRSRFVGGKVSKSSIHKLLSNPVYYGVISYQGQLHKAIHKPLTTKAVFDKVQLVLLGKNKTKKQKHDFLYRGYMHCGTCGCMLTATIKKGRYHYYYCTNGKRICNENQTYMNEPYVKGEIQELFDEFTLDEDFAELAFDIYIENLKKNFQSKGNQREIIQNQIDSIDCKLDRLIDMRLEGSIDEVKFKEKQTKLKNEKVGLEIALTQVKEENLDRTLELLEDFKKRACSLDEMFENGGNEVRAELLKSVLWNLEIQERKILSVQYKLPYEYVKNLNKTHEMKTWRAYQNCQLQ